jgi:hypothetical protein
MANKAIRHQHAARLAKRQPAAKHEYEILDPSHTPDLHGQLAGGKVYFRGGKQYVRISEAQAQFYLDSGSLQKVEQPQARVDVAPPPDPAPLETKT